jgi:EmrB/QacA subfamily drug resistance transporter
VTRPEPAADPRPGIVLAALLIAGVAFAVLQTAVAPALPAIAREFGTSLSTVTWLLTGFLLSASVATPIVGKLGDVHGKGRVLTAVLAVFGLGSVLCALAPSIEVLIAGRIIQGVAGGVFPLSFGIIRDTFPPARVPTAIGSISAVFGIGGGFGLVIAGVIVDHAHIDWLFWLGIIALPAAVVVRRVVPNTITARRARIDWVGAGVLSAGLVCLLLAFSYANGWGWDSARFLGLVAAGLVLLVAWVALELRTPEPLVDIRLLRERPVLFTNLTGLIIGFAMFASFLLVPQFVQTPERAGYGFGATVTEAGLVMLPSTLVMLVAGPSAGLLAGRLGPRAPLAIGTALAGASFALLAVAHSEVWHFVVAVMLLGFGLGFSFSAMANLVVSAVPQGSVGVATGINTIMRTVGGALGSQIAIAIVTAQTVAGTPLPAESGYTAAFALSAVGALLALAAVAAIPGGRARDEEVPVRAAEPQPA